jgi:alpha-D-xyloside xylohydrolase
MGLYDTQRTFLTDDRRIFHRPDCKYDTVVEATSASMREDVMTVSLRLSSGRAMKLSVHALGPGLLRVRAWRGRARFHDTSDMLVRPDVSPARGSMRETKRGFTFSGGGLRLQVDRRPFAVRVSGAKGDVLWQLEDRDPVARSLGMRGSAEGEHPFLSWRITNEDRLFGMGEKWNTVEKTGTRATIWSADTCGTNTNDLSYKAVPVLFSTKGWGMMLHSTYRSYWEIGSSSYTAGSFLTEDAGIDLLLFAAPSLKGLLRKYTGLTGRPMMPPKWALGVWLSRCQYRSRGEAEAAVRGMRRRRIPMDVVHLDPQWMKVHYYPERGVDACDFEWDEEDFPDRDTMYCRWADDGVAVCHWVNPYLPEGTPIYREAEAEGYLVKDPRGKPCRPAHGNAVGIVDFTYRQAKEWWKDHLKELLRAGAAVFKPDYGELVPEFAVFHDGRTGAEMHNPYLFLYNRAVFEATREEKGYNLIWGRSGYIGSQRYPGTWAGDTQVSWHAMKCCLRGGLSASMTGWSFWSCDIGGFTGPMPDRELYIRWAQWGLLTPFSRFHGTTPREPWQYGEQAVRVARRYARLRYALMPYLLAAAEESTRTGTPMMRHMALEFEDEPNVHTIDDQYMLGPDLLVAPVMTAGARSRDVYLPEGIWTEMDRPGAVHLGRTFAQVRAPLGRIPLLVREGAVVPKLTGNPQHLKDGPARRIEVDVYPGGRGRTVSWTDDGVRVRISAESSARAVRFAVRAAPLKVRVRFVGVARDSARVNGKRVAAKVTRDTTIIDLDAAEGAEVEL